MSGASSIEWTDATCPCYYAPNGTDQGGCGEDRSEEVRRVTGGVSAARRIRAEVVRSLPLVARSRGLRVGRKPIRRPDLKLPRGAQRVGSLSIQAKGAASTGSLIRASSRRRRAPSSAPGQLLRRDRTSGSPEFAPLFGLRPCLAARGAAA